MVNTRRIELADGVVDVIRGVEVARRIERQAAWAVQICAGEGGLAGGDRGANIACGIVSDDGVVG